MLPAAKDALDAAADRALSTCTGLPCCGGGLVSRWRQWLGLAADAEPEPTGPLTVHGAGVALHRASGRLDRSALALWADGPDGLGWRFRDGAVAASPLVQLVFSAPDWRAIQAAGLPAWERGVLDTLERLLGRAGVQWPAGVAQPCIALLPDGHAHLGRHHLGLEAGQFASVILPHRWPHPDQWAAARDTRSRRRVWVATPHRTELLEAGFLWDGQASFTLGTDPLDSAQVPEQDDGGAVSVHPPGRRSSCAKTTACCTPP